MLYTQPRFTVTEETVRRIADMIRSGDYGPGDRLPGERQLAQQLQVGRTSVREAIHRLQAVGLIEARQGRGTYVKDPSERVVLASLAPHILTNQQKLSQLYDLREIIEVAAAGWAAERASSEQVAGMRKWVETVLPVC